MQSSVEFRRAEQIGLVSVLLELRGSKPILCTACHDLIQSLFSQFSEGFAPRVFAELLTVGSILQLPGIAGTLPAADCCFTTTPSAEVDIVTTVLCRFSLDHRCHDVLDCLLLAILLAFAAGCRRSDEPSEASGTPVPPASDTDAPDPVEAASLPRIEASAEQLLAARLPIDESGAGWVRLFDGHTFFGWQAGQQANWRIEEGAIHVDQGQIGLLATAVPWQDFELTLEVRAGEATNSGIFLRSPLQPEDPEVDCCEVNIAPPDNPFPTGSVVGRLRADQTPQLDPQRWHRFDISLVADTLIVQIDGEEICRYSDPNPLGPGRIGLQHNSGPVAFRDIRVRPVGLQGMLDEDLQQWKQYPEMDGEFRVTDEGHLRVTGGRGQLESRQSYDDFVLLAEAKTASEKLNSGIFFRCIPGSTMDGYEAQISNELIDGNPLAPADCGTGGIFRRQDARIVASEDDQWFSMLLVAAGPQMAAWVNGLQVADWRDDRAVDENPRRGLRLQAGTLMIQAHDPTTDMLLRRIDIAELHAAP